MIEKLINYGFQDWQVKKLLKDKKLNCSHGTYELKNNKLLLIQNNNIKQIDI